MQKHNYSEFGSIHTIFEKQKAIGNMKVLHFICGIAGIIFLSTSVNGFTCGDDTLYRHEDINYFYACEQPGAQPDVVKCREGYGFLRNEVRTGCVRFEEWQCTSKDGLTPPDCSRDDVFSKLHHHLNPNSYWACPLPQGTSAIKMECPAGRGFLEDHEFYGCVNWNEWKCSDLD